MHVHVNSIDHVLLHPSPFTVFASSQVSETVIDPSPQYDQTLKVPVQTQPDSTTQAELQPSPFAVLPSSQASFGLTSPLPHRYHTLGTPEQLQLVSTWQLELQSSLLIVLPSSQASPVLMMLLLQTREHTFGVALVQV